ncbi:unnamed protein product [Adineta steineri]|uniref:Uncharacterized protein n=1 Tax=Adineta steineri TaxID=433720 RepID=A0A818X0A5_9BILA|nr:unnamed protein product [Adineta steineri]CAF3732965.1 unnamed protein product [Adineta steineri]
MGCILPKKVTVVPMITTQTKDYSVNNGVRAQQPSNIVQEISPRSTPLKNNQEIKSRVSSNKSNKSIKQVQSTDESTPLNICNGLMPFHGTVIKHINTKTTTSNIDQQIISRTTSSTSNKRNLHVVHNTNLILSNSNDIATWQKQIEIITVESDLSDTSADETSDGTSNEQDESNLSYNDVISPLSSAHTKNKLFRQDSSVRFTSPMPKDSNIQEETHDNDPSIDSDGIPFYGSIDNSTPSCSKQSSIYEEDMFPSRSASTHNFNIEQNITDHELARIKSYDAITNSASSNGLGKKMIRPRITVKSKSPKIIKSDIHQGPITYETSSDSDESEID